MDRATQSGVSAAAWRTRTGALERGLWANGFKTYWNLSGGFVSIQPDGVVSLNAHDTVVLSTNEYEPSAKD